MVVRVIGIALEGESNPVYSTAAVEIPGVPQRPDEPVIRQQGSNINVDWSSVTEEERNHMNAAEYEVVVRTKNQTFETVSSCN